jgi:sugar (pentulose or hexulose) kinase
LSAGIGAGIYRDYAEAVQAAVSVVRVHEPIAASTPHYLARYAEYRRLIDAMQTPWQELSKLS